MAITVSTPTIEKLSETSIRVTYANSDGATNWRFIVSNGTNDTRQTDITTDTVFTFIELSAGYWYAVVVAYTVAMGTMLCHKSNKMEYLNCLDKARIPIL
jgi:uncharacterized GH25 family protein